MRLTIGEQKVRNKVSRVKNHVMEGEKIRN